ncbi:hypothetical protein MKEN_01109500 [Mycena kentingensis (nom. inval.)]|nr:hypothetical protein MKEN_01109500 [Mycena kentingensis (nom. inval.)]
MRSPFLVWLLVAALVIILTAIYTISHPTPFVVPSLRFLSPSSVAGLALPQAQAPLVLPPPTTRILPIPARTFIINLERRTDRRESMEVLRAGVDAPSHWTYVFAQDAHAPWPVRVLHRVRALREAVFATYPRSKWELDGELIKLPFAWPDPMPDPHPAPFDEASLALDFPVAEEPTLLVRTRSTPLTRGVVSCYRSHLSALELAAQQTDAASLIMEDDVDMEIDIQARLDKIWGALPADWDVVYLGHCWSDETAHAPLPIPTHSSASLHVVNGTVPRLHPSRAPLCTHAYAVSPAGARRLLSHLTLPSFAYSRPIDNAIAHLIETDRVKSYTVVPNVIIQRDKRGVSDISGRLDNVGGWEAKLVNGFFAKLDREEAEEQERRV